MITCAQNVTKLAGFEWFERNKQTNKQTNGWWQSNEKAHPKNQGYSLMTESGELMGKLEIRQPKLRSKWYMLNRFFLCLLLKVQSNLLPGWRRPSHVWRMPRRTRRSTLWTVSFVFPEVSDKWCVTVAKQVPCYLILYFWFGLVILYISLYFFIFVCHERFTKIIFVFCYYTGYWHWC